MAPAKKVALESFFNRFFSNVCCIGLFIVSLHCFPLFICCISASFHPCFIPDALISGPCSPSSSFCFSFVWQCFEKLRVDISVGYMVFMLGW
jgi:hypothetical protein